MNKHDKTKTNQRGTMDKATWYGMPLGSIDRHIINLIFHPAAMHCSPGGDVLVTDDIGMIVDRLCKGMPDLKNDPKIRKYLRYEDEQMSGDNLSYLDLYVPTLVRVVDRSPESLSDINKRLHRH